MISANGKTTLGRLSASDKYLWRGEQMVMWRFVVCVVVPLFLRIGRIWFGTSIFYYNALILSCAAASLLWVVMETKIARDRRQAARILQLAECEMYGVRWNEHLCGATLLPEDVFLNHRLDIDRYKGWYQDMSTQSAGFIQNIRNIAARYAYNSKHHLLVCKWIAGVAMVIVMAIPIFEPEMNFNGTLFYAVLPCVPIMVWIHGIVGSYKRGKAQLKLIDINESYIVEELEQEQKNMIQDCVFLYRDNFYLVPRFFAKKNTKKNA